MKFKSIDKIYHKERLGFKPNTIRKIDLTDDRFLHLISKYYSGFNDGDIIIEIVNADTGDCFERVVTDLTIWDGYIIISWKHMEDV